MKKTTIIFAIVAVAIIAVAALIAAETFYTLATGESAWWGLLLRIR